MNNTTLNPEQLRIEKSSQPKERPPLVQRFQQTRERLSDSVNRIKSSFGQLMDRTKEPVDLTEEQHTLDTLGNQFNKVTSSTEGVIRTDSLIPDREGMKTEAADEEKKSDKESLAKEELGKNNTETATRSEITFFTPTKFERINLPEGQLFLVKPPPKDFPQDFQEKLIATEPWHNTGKTLGRFRRRIEKFTIDGVDVVLKQTERTGEDVRRINKRSEALTNSISAQIGILEHAKASYKEAYGEELPVEEIVAAYIDRASTRKYLMYRYYDAIDLSDNWKDAEKANILEEAIGQVEQINKKLNAIGVDRGEKGNYIITRDPKSEKGWKVMLIDTEFWTIKGKYD